MAKVLRFDTVNEATPTNIDLSGTTGDKALLVTRCEETHRDGVQQQTSMMIGAASISYLGAVPDLPFVGSHVEHWMVDDSDATFAMLNGASVALSFVGAINNIKYMWFLIDEITSGTTITPEWNQENLSAASITNADVSSAVNDCLLQVYFCKELSGGSVTFDGSLTRVIDENLGSPNSWMAAAWKTVGSAETDVDYTATPENSVDSQIVSTLVFPAAAASNLAPVLGAIGNRTVEEGTELAFTISATDDSDTPSFSITGLPTGATFVDNSDGTASFAWTPSGSQSGTYNVTFNALDSESAIDSEEIVITVTDLVSGGGGGGTAPGGADNSLGRAISPGLNKTLAGTLGL